MLAALPFQGIGIRCLESEVKVARRYTMKLVQVIPELSTWRAEIKRAEKAKRLAFEIDKAHHFALIEYGKTHGVGFAKFESQRKNATESARRAAAEKKAQRILWLESKRKALAEKRAVEIEAEKRALVRWAWKNGPTVEIKPETVVPVYGVVKLYAEVAEAWR